MQCRGQLAARFCDKARVQIFRRIGDSGSPVLRIDQSAKNLAFCADFRRYHCSAINQSLSVMVATEQYNALLTRLCREMNKSLGWVSLGLMKYKKLTVKASHTLYSVVRNNTTNFLRTYSLTCVNECLTALSLTVFTQRNYFDPKFQVQGVANHFCTDS